MYLPTYTRNDSVRRAIERHFSESRRRPIKKKKERKGLRPENYVAQVRDTHSALSRSLARTNKERIERRDARRNILAGPSRERDKAARYTQGLLLLPATLKLRAGIMYGGNNIELIVWWRDDASRTLLLAQGIYGEYLSLRVLSLSFLRGRACASKRVYYTQRVRSVAVIIFLQVLMPSRAEREEISLARTTENPARVI